MWFFKELTGIMVYRNIKLAKRYIMYRFKYAKLR